MSRHIVIHAECTPPTTLAAIGASPERMSKTVPEQGAAEAAREFAEACVRLGIFACHGTVTMTFTVCTNNGHCQYLADAKSMCAGCRSRAAPETSSARCTCKDYPGADQFCMAHNVQAVCDRAAHLADVPMPRGMPSDPRPPGCRCGDFKNPRCPVHGAASL